MWEGTGWPADPYQIATARDLVDVGTHSTYLNKHFVLTADIDLSEYQFAGSPIAPRTTDRATGFSGSFDGDGYLIRGRSGGAWGLFGKLVSGANVSNLGLEDVELSGGEHSGGLVRINYGNITRCYSAGWHEYNGYAPLVATSRLESNIDSSFWITNNTTKSMMQDINTFLGAKWDIVPLGEIAPEHTWWIKADSYPKLWWQSDGP